MPMNDYAYFQLAMKGLVFFDGKLLVLRTHTNQYDFPGGRMDRSELSVPHVDILHREIQEELGTDITYRVGDVAFVSRRHYTMHGQDNHVILLYYRLELEGGKVVLSDEHTAHEWMHPKDILAHPDKFISSFEYEQFSRYFP